MPRHGSLQALLTLLTGTLLACAGLAWAQDPPPATEVRLRAFPLERIEPGLEGFGLTAGPGNRIERFWVRVLARQDGLGPGGQPLVLIAASGALIDAAGGVAAGMSGSPVYLDLDGEQALLGAIAYVFPDSDGHLALVTPIEAMRSQTLTRAPPWRAPTGAVPVATPVLVAGLGARALALLEDTVLPLAPQRLSPVRAGGSGPGDSDPTPLQAGSAIALQLVRGDVDVAAIGTVTEIVGPGLLALGHPFLGTGPASWALAPASITAIVPNRRVPFKLANVGPELLGAVVADRPAGVAARLDERPELIPVTLSVDLEGQRQTLRFEVAAAEPLWPLLVAVATLEALDRAWSRVAPGSATLAWELGLEGGPPLRLLEQVSSASDVALAAARMAGAPLALLAENAFETPRPTSLQLLIEVDERRRDGELVEVLLEAGPLRAGGTIGLHLRLQPWRRQSEVHTLSVTLPDALAADAELVVRGAGEPRDDDHDGGVDTLILSYAELLTVLRERPRSGDLVIEVMGADGRWQVLERRSFPYLVRGVERVALELDASDDDDD